MKRISHTITDADLVAYADNQSSSVPAAEIEEFLARNPDAAARIASWRRQNDAIRGAYGHVDREPLPVSLSLAHARPRAAPPAGPGKAVAASSGVVDEPIRQVVRFRRPAAARSEARPPRAASLAVLAVLAIMALYASGVSGIGPSLPDFLQTSPVIRPAETVPQGDGLTLARRAGEAHRTYVAGVENFRAGEWTLAQDASLAGWLSRRTGTRIALPDFSSLGLRLVGGRITPGESGPAAFLLYESATRERVGLFISKIVSNEDAPPVYREDRSTGTLTWARNGAGFVLTATGDADRLMRLWRLAAP
jgi:anti-sigma factor RsiW